MGVLFHKMVFYSKPEPDPDLDPARRSERCGTGLLKTLPLSHGTRSWINFNPASRSSPHQKSQIRICLSKAHTSSLPLQKMLHTHTHSLVLEVPLAASLCQTPSQGGITDVGSRGLTFPILHVF